MKREILVILLIVLTVLISCTKVNNRNMEVIKDCTGSYLRFNEKDYHICNTEVVENYDNGTEVKASFEKIDICSDSDEVVCQMLHHNEGWIYVTKIK